MGAEHYRGIPRQRVRKLLLILSLVVAVAGSVGIFVGGPFGVVVGVPAVILGVGNYQQYAAKRLTKGQIGFALVAILTVLVLVIGHGKIR
jgi:hypothetical protein